MAPRRFAEHTEGVPPTFVVVPQWQGSVSERAMRLCDGAEAIRGDLPASATRTVDVPVEAGDSENTSVNRFSSLLQVREGHAAALRAADDWVLTIGGDCGVSLTAVEHASKQHPGTLAVVWLDAHPDLHTPESSPSGAFSGMVLRAISGEGAERLALSPAVAVPLERVVLAGARDIDPAEDALIRDRAIPVLDVESADFAVKLTDAVRHAGASAVYLHIDLDVLDPSALSGLANPVPFGITIEGLTAAITALRAQFPLAGATIAGFAPVSPEAASDDLSPILRIIGALTR
ncbi:arginase family protein [Glaciibacter psychrotolerans]|uniref:arginase family protein n=1 Tax=Glaciibacter psychrotolerans TaxID=670054 RepID=UPI001C547ABC|nr:arginase family protein [Leifsonia psychrotolerans]